jgi:hypothetical protein
VAACWRVGYGFGFGGAEVQFGGLSFKEHRADRPVAGGVAGPGPLLRGGSAGSDRGAELAAAIAAAATHDRVDLGLGFTYPPQTARLPPGGGPGQATHRVSFRNMGEVDAEIVRLLRVAYEQNV